MYEIRWIVGDIMGKVGEMCIFGGEMFGISIRSG